MSIQDVPIALQAYPGLPSFLRHWRYCQISSRLGCLLRLRLGRVNDHIYFTTDKH